MSTSQALPTARIGIVENDLEFREEVVRRLEALDFVRAPVLNWASAEQFLREKPAPRLDLMFVDIMLSGINGIELIKILKQQKRDLKAVMLTNMNSDELIFESIKHGTLGYILKSELGDLEHAVRTVLSGGAMITPTIALRVFSSFQKKAKSAPDLTDRERQVLELMVRGKTAKAVAEFLGLSPHTIHDYTKQIYKKLEVHNRSELILKAQELSLM
ncbi:MAG: response regulator transcription factor [bacterium]|nr:response regulator transcription factor [bacterium]